MKIFHREITFKLINIILFINAYIFHAVIRILVQVSFEMPVFHKNTTCLIFLDYPGAQQNVLLIKTVYKEDLIFFMKLMKRAWYAGLRML